MHYVMNKQATLMRIIREESKRKSTVLAALVVMNAIDRTASWRR